VATRSDQLHSQQFTLARVVAALAVRDPDPAASPLRRIGGSLMAGVLLAALGLAAVGVYGILRPGGSTSWRSGNAVIVEEETGTRFVYRDGVLHPVLNYSSAVLVIGQPSPSRVRVSRASLAGVPRGSVLGIAGAPDALPAASDLLGGAWTLCSRPSEANPAAPESLLTIGAQPAVTAHPLGDSGLLASDPGGGLHLLWHARRYAIAAPDLVLAAFAWSRSAAVPVSTALLNSLAAGPDLGPVSVPRRASSGASASSGSSASSVSSVDGYAVGQVIVVETATGDRRFGIVLPTGLADLTASQADLLLADPAGPGGRAVPMGQSQYAAAPKSPVSLVPTGANAPPASPPQLANLDPQAGICAEFAPATAASLTVVASPHVPGELRTRAGTGDVTTPVDVVAVPPGHGALVSAAGALGLVVDLGVRYPVPSADVARVLGYSDVVPLQLPPSLVSLLPTGRALDPSAALLPASSA
jgi:type VII secretion protein EccB